MSELTWQQACACHGATATRGRILRKRVTDYKGGSFRIETTLHNEPVCDRCDAPWTLALFDPSSS